MLAAASLKAAASNADPSAMALSGSYPRDRLKHMTTMVMVILGTVLLIAVASFWWPPLALLTVPLIWVVWRETNDRGLLDPARLRKGLRGEQSVQEVLDGLGKGYRVL